MNPRVGVIQMGLDRIATVPMSVGGEAPDPTIPLITAPVGDVATLTTSMIALQGGATAVRALITLKQIAGPVEANLVGIGGVCQTGSATHVVSMGILAGTAPRKNERIARIIANPLPTLGATGTKAPEAVLPPRRVAMCVLTRARMSIP